MFSLRAILCVFVISSFGFVSLAAENYKPVAETGKFSVRGTTQTIQIGCSYGAISKIKIERLGAKFRHQGLLLNKMNIKFASGDSHTVSYKGLVRRVYELNLNRQACVESVTITGRTTRLNSRVKFRHTYKALVSVN